jgi:DNA-directed RNA polymerase subunit RPC12/RpoP
MSVSFECVQCEAEFELEVSDILREPSLVKCPNCGKKANPKIVENAFLAFDEFLEQVGRLSKKFRVAVSLEPDEIVEDPSDEFLDDDDDETSLWGDDVEEDEEEEM